MADNFTVYYEYSGDQPIDQAYLYPLSPECAHPNINITEQL